MDGGSCDGFPQPLCVESVGSVSAAPCSAAGTSSSSTSPAMSARDEVRPLARYEISPAPGHRVYLDDAQRAWCDSWLANLLKLSG